MIDVINCAGATCWTVKKQYSEWTQLWKTTKADSDGIGFPTRVDGHPSTSELATLRATRLNVFLQRMLQTTLSGASVHALAAFLGVDLDQHTGNGPATMGGAEMDEYHRLLTGQHQNQRPPLFTPPTEVKTEGSIYKYRRCDFDDLFAVAPSDVELSLPNFDSTPPHTGSTSGSGGNAALLLSGPSSSGSLFPFPDTVGGGCFDNVGLPSIAAMPPGTTRDGLVWS